MTEVINIVTQVDNPRSSLFIHRDLDREEGFIIIAVYSVNCGSSTRIGSSRDRIWLCAAPAFVIGPAIGEIAQASRAIRTTGLKVISYCGHTLSDAKLNSQGVVIGTPLILHIQHRVWLAFALLNVSVVECGVLELTYSVSFVICFICSDYPYGPFAADSDV